MPGIGTTLVFDPNLQRKLEGPKGGFNCESFLCNTIHQLLIAESSWQLHPRGS